MWRRLLLGDRSLRMGREKNSADEQTRPWPKPDEEYPATESRMIQARYEPNEEYPATESRMPDEEYLATESRMIQAWYEPDEETYS